MKNCYLATPLVLVAVLGIDVKGLRAQEGHESIFHMPPGWSPETQPSLMGRFEIAPLPPAALSRNGVATVEMQRRRLIRDWLHNRDLSYWSNPDNANYGSLKSTGMLFFGSTKQFFDLTDFEKPSSLLLQGISSSSPCRIFPKD
jgi:hypothetical protein